MLREIDMPLAWKRLDLICFGLYLVAIFVGTSMEALAQILAR
jgi:hypothetical protein